MFKSWMGEYPCDMGEYKDKCTISDHDPIPVGRWEGISRVVQERGTGRWLATDLFGDPGANPVPLIHNYSLEYAPGPDITVCPVSQPLWECTAGYLNISLMHSNTTVAETRALRNETFEYEDPYDQTTVTLQFFEGKATPQQMPSPGGCPCTDMEVHLQPVPARKAPELLFPPGSAAPSATQQTPVPFFYRIARILRCSGKQTEARVKMPSIHRIW